MAIIAQGQLFTWEEIEDLGDLKRLKLVLESLPDEALMRELEKKRGHGRNDYPVRPMWNSILAGVVFGHESTASLRRELLRNAQLRYVCGFDVLRGVSAVPTPSAYTHFLEALMEEEGYLERMLDELVDALSEVLPDWGQTLAVDSKAIRSCARRAPKVTQRDGRRDVDADKGTKTSWKRDKDGTLYQRVKSWFGYKLHLIVDANYDLPVAYEVSKASTADVRQGRKMLSELAQRHPGIVEQCEIFTGDKAYDDGKLIRELWDEHEIKAVIPIRDLHKDGEETWLVEGTQNVVYDYAGHVMCCCPKTGTLSPMAFGGFEKDRETLKYRCPARHYKMECPGRAQCPIQGAVRIKLSQDRRVFTPLARSSYAWEEEYRKRSAVERVNSRLDVSFGFERHFIRGIKKMKLRCGLALIVMLAMALGRIKEKQRDRMRSLVQAA